MVEKKRGGEKKSRDDKRRGESRWEGGSRGKRGGKKLLRTQRRKGRKRGERWEDMRKQGRGKEKRSREESAHFCF